MVDYLVTKSGISILDIPNKPDILLSSESLECIKNDEQSRLDLLNNCGKNSIIVQCIGDEISDSEFRKFNSIYRVNK